MESARDARDGRDRKRTMHSGGQGRHSRGHGQPVVAFLRANPQVLVLLVICLVLGLGTFFAVLFGLVSAGSDQTTGEPSGTILALLQIAV
jgi:hypothetical protein